MSTAETKKQKSPARLEKKKKRRKIAYHEAGHAVAARILGIGVPYVAMISIDDDTPASAMTESASWAARNAPSADQQKACELDIKIAMAGPCAQQRYEGRYHRRPLDFSALKGHDDFNILNMAVHHIYHATGREIPAEGEDAQIQLSDDDQVYLRALTARLWEETETLVSGNWAAIERVAKTLMIRDLIDQAELDALISNQPLLQPLMRSGNSRFGAKPKA
jgi:hypothetical protein